MHTWIFGDQIYKLFQEKQHDNKFSDLSYHILYLIFYTLFVRVFYSKFRNTITKDNSTVKISDEVPRDIAETIHAVNFSAGLNTLFAKNLAGDETMR